VYSTLVPAGTAFALSGNFVQSPVTRTALTTSSALGCTGTTYATTTPVTLTASIIANGPVTPSGNIVFSANGTPLPQGTVAVSNIGTTAAPVYGATFTYTFSTANTYNITATYQPATYFNTSTSSVTTITSTAPTFTAALNANQEATVAQGGTALYSFTLTQTVYAGTFSFACSGLPVGASCSFSQSISATGCSASNTVTLSILTTAPTVAQSGFGPGGRGPWQALSLAAGLGLALLLGLRRRRTALRFGQLWMMLALLVAASSFVACGKGTSGPAATPIGSYPITVTVTGSTGTTTSFPVSLTVH